MSKFNLANLKKTVYYFQRNGFRNTLYAVRERIGGSQQPEYTWTPLGKETLVQQREKSAQGFSKIKFSIVVPAYRTPEVYLREMIDSVINQTYPNWELILADATEDDSVKSVVETYEDSRVRYHELSGNNGIAENTNQGIALAEGDYVGLLDHDDVLTENALFEMASRIEKNRREGIELQLLYSDEDKCNGDRTVFYEPHFKEKFNLDLLLNNNYICHFLIMKRELIQELRFRKAYDGAQDFDLVLRAAEKLWTTAEQIAHIPMVLYHWRCHSSSTAENPRSKMYAYEAGRRAVQDFADVRGWEAQAQDTEHLGFYRLEYRGELLAMRQELGAVGGPLISGGKVIGGSMDKEGRGIYNGLPVSYSGYMHRAVLQQEADVLDIRNLELRDSLKPVFEEILGIPYVVIPGTEIFDAMSMPENMDYISASVKLCAKLREQGYKLLYLPERRKKLKRK